MRDDTGKAGGGMTVGELCNRLVVIADRKMPVSEAARLMREHHVGTLVVVDETERGRVPVGIVTDRDIVVAVVAKELAPANITVGDMMGSEVVTVAEQDGVLDALGLMRARGVRRVPVTGADGMLVGILALDDVLEVVAEQLDDLARAIASERVHEVKARR